MRFFVFESGVWAGWLTFFWVVCVGLSKAQRGLHLNEDIYAGMSVLMRGGINKHVEYMQVGKGKDLGNDHPAPSSDPHRYLLTPPHQKRIQLRPSLLLQTCHGNVRTNAFS